MADELHWTIDSKNQVPKVVGSIGELISLRPCPQEDISDFMIVTQEAVVNAVEHGNVFEPGKHVSVGLKLRAETVELWVRDQGPGFDPTGVPDPTSDNFIEELMKDQRPARGWGIHIIRCLADRVHWNDSGNEIHIFKKLRLAN